MIGKVGIEPETALWMTPREIQAASDGYMQARREEVAMHPMAEFKSDRQAKKFIKGDYSGGAPPEEEQQRKLDQLKEKMNQ